MIAICLQIQLVSSKHSGTMLVMLFQYMGNNNILTKNYLTGLGAVLGIYSAYIGHIAVRIGANINCPKA